jgi:hypothetical protein
VPYRLGAEELWALVYVLVEHQSAEDQAMPLRLLYLVVLYWERQWRLWASRPAPRPPLRLSPVLPLVLYTGAGPWENNRTLHDLLGEPAGVHGFVSQRLHRAGGVVAVPLYIAAVREEAWHDGLAAGQLHASRRMLLALIETRFGRVDDWLRWRIESCKNVEVLMIAAQRVGAADRLEDLESFWPVFNTSPAEVGRRPTVEHFLWYTAWEKGVAEGESGALRDVLRALLTERFGSLPKTCLDAIADMADPQRLRQGVLQAAWIASLDAMRL